MSRFATASRPVSPEVTKALQERIWQQEEQDGREKLSTQQAGFVEFEPLEQN